MEYGTLVARIKMPAGQGIWPSFWMLGTAYQPVPGNDGWPDIGEIDMMELVNNGDTYYVTLHGPQSTPTGTTDYYGGSSSGNVVGNHGSVADLTADYHDYWVIRRPDEIIIGVDDKTLGVFTPASLPPGGQWVFNAPMFAILQISVGGPWPGPPDSPHAVARHDAGGFVPLHALRLRLCLRSRHWVPARPACRGIERLLAERDATVPSWRGPN